MLDEVDAAAAFFDFRIADIAMGSGHFLIAAIDRIEKRMADFLTKRDLPGVRRELAGLRSTARQALGELAESSVIEDGQLLRRTIARRCVYGVDANALAVQLARLSVWIHTFVQGLPLSILDRTLVQGNSLVGVGGVEEIRARFAEASGTYPLLAKDADQLLGAASEPLDRLAKVNDATLADIASAREAMREARDAIRETAELCDLIAAGSVSDDDRVRGFAFEEWDRADSARDAAVDAARRDLEGLQRFHFPVAFPEVFLRARPGFDVILGNPPWQEATLEEHAFWARHFPGLRSLSQREQESEKERLRKERPDLVALYEAELSETNRVRKALVGGSYPGMSTGDPDLYKAFCWRFWHLTAADGGRMGVVLPRSALAAKGSTEFRRTVFAESAGANVTMLLNNRKWVFDEVHPQYTIGLVCVAHGTPAAGSVRIRGPFASHTAFAHGIRQSATAFDHDHVLAWNDSASLPLLPSDGSVEVFAQLRKSPRLDLNAPGEWRARPDSELHATNQKHLMDLESESCPDGYWPVYKGESFDLWEPDRGVYYAWADPEPALHWLQEKRVRAGKRQGNSPHREFPIAHLKDRQTLPCFAPRVAFRDVSRSTDTRTVRSCLVPPKVFIANQAPNFLWPRGDEKDQAFLVGVLSSAPLDWYARRFVETHVSFFVLNPFPIPRPPRTDARWQRAVQLAGRLACPDDRFADWANTVGVDCGPLETPVKDDLIHELDAVVAHLYGLSEVHVGHIFETFHEGWDYGERLSEVLRHYRDWARRG